MGNDGGAASPRTDAGKRLLGRLYRTDPANGAAGLSREYLHGRLRLTEDIRAIEAEMERWPSTGMVVDGLALMLGAEIDGSKMSKAHIEAATVRVKEVLLREAAQEAPAPEGLRLALASLIEAAESAGDYLNSTIMNADIRAARKALAAAEPPTPAEPSRLDHDPLDDIPAADMTPEQYRRWTAAGHPAKMRAEARPPEGLDADRLARALGTTNRNGWANGVSPLTYTAWAKAIAAEYARLSAGGATKPTLGNRPDVAAKPRVAKATRGAKGAKP